MTTALAVAALSLLLGTLLGNQLNRARARGHGAALRRARAVLHALPDTWLIIDGFEHIVEVHMVPRPGSRGAVPQLRDQTIDDFFSAKVVGKVKEARSRCLEEGKEQRFELDIRLRGDARAALARVVPLFDGEVLVVIQDLSERKMQERALRDAQRAAESMLEARTEAFARLGHDVRNQMTGVITIADSLLLHEVAPSTRRYLETILRCGDNIVQLLTQMMELSRIERGGLVLRPERLALRAFIEAALEPIRALLSEGVRLEARARADAPDSVVIDVGRLSQILTNLLHNAAKFTRAGAITIELRPGTSAARFVVAVSDTGPGIDAAALPHIFDAYFQAHDTASSREGSGLGLAIVQSLVRAMGGEVSVESRLGEGTTFTVTLPREPPAHDRL